MKNKKASIIVPMYNEADSIDAFLARIYFAFAKSKLRYEIIFIDDNSTDGTFEKIELAKKANGTGRTKKIKLYRKEGRRGKAFSLMEGFERATGSVIAMIDGDLQYPPEAIPLMVDELEEGDIVVANRKNYDGGILRRVLSKTFSLAFGRFLFGLNHDVQSGLKVMTREAIESIKFMPSSSWTFDLEFLHRARQAGYVIKNFDISFARRENGASKIDFIKTAFEIGINALSLRRKRIHPVPILPKKKGLMLGAGIGYKRKKYITHTTMPYHTTAISTLTLNQKIILFLIALEIVIGFIFYPLLTLQVIIGVLSFIYFVDVLFNLFLTMKSLNFPQEINSSLNELAKIDEKKLPIYTILCPLYREIRVLPQFLISLNKLSWPKEKLDVILLLEENDKETIGEVRKMDLPFYVRTLIVPHSIPKTKPKACNYGLSHAKGEYLVIYDAEDMPDILQLKKAYLGFQKIDKDIICLQAKLNYYNPHQNLLTRFFTAEYSLWFDLTLPGLQSINTTIPLGGTSNHFRIKSLIEVEGWDPFNVTEDADLGMRLFKKGFRTAIIDSTTLEEANSRIGNWLRQRSRWIKGYMQTYLVHIRDVFKFSKDKGKHSLIFQLVIGGKIAFILINPLLWLATIAYFAMYAYVGPAIESLYPSVVFYMAVSSLVFGNFLFLYYYMIGVAKRGQWNLMKFVFLIPFYWLMISIAAFRALCQLIFKPHYWEKTVHGFHLDKTESRLVKIAKMPITQQVKILQNNIADLFGLFAKLKESIASKKSGKLKILIFNWRDTKHKWAGGAEVYLHELAKRFVKDGNTVTIFSGKGGQKLINEKIDGVQMFRRGGFYTVYVWAYLYYMLKFRGKFDVIIDSENGIPFFTPLYAKENKFLLIHHVHQEVFRKSLRWPLSWIARILEAKLMPIVYRNVQIITVSPSSKEEIMRHKLTKKEPIIIYNGVDLAKFKPGEKSKKPTILYLGRLQYYKSLNIFIRAAKKVIENISNIEFVVAGEGEEKQNLQKLAEKLGLQKNIKFLGKVSEKRKVKLFQNAWVFVNPSFMEGWGITTIEAAACGTPAIASNVPGLRDSVKNPHTGTLIRYGDHEGFAREILRLVEDEKLRKSMSIDSINWAKNFSWKKSAGEFLKVISS